MGACAHGHTHTKRKKVGQFRGFNVSGIVWSIVFLGEREVLKFLYFGYSNNFGTPWVRA